MIDSLGPCTFTSSTVYASLAHFESDFLKKLADASGDSICVEFVSKVRIELSSIDCLDKLHLFMEQVKDLLEFDANLNQNGITGPSRYCGDSFFGIFIRTILAKWEIADFETTCEIFDNIQRFTTHGMYESGLILNVESDSEEDDDDITFEDFPRTKSKRSPYSGFQGLEMAQTLQIIQQATVNGDIALAQDYIHRYFDFNGSDPMDFYSNIDHTTLSKIGTSGVAEYSEANVNIARSIAAMTTLQSPFPRAELYRNSIIMARQQQQLQPLSTAAASSHNTYVNRHQHAMISLATMWTLCGNYSMALSAVEGTISSGHNCD